MKRIILTAAVIASAVACSKTEIVEMAPQTPISFGNTFVDNATRSIDKTLKTGTLTEFQVYGSVTWTDQGANPAPPNTVNLYNGVTVTNVTTNKPSTVVEDSGWWYDGAYTQYWIEGNAYQFAAIVNGTAATFSKDANTVDNMPLTISYNAAGQEDLLYAEHSIDSYAASAGSDVVKFTFNHLLSKVQFTFENKMVANTANSKYTYRVSDIKITNAYMYGTYTIDGGTWGSYSNRNVVEFGNITNADDASDSDDAIPVGAGDQATSHYSKLLIPNTYTDLNITYTIETLLNNQVIDKDELAANPASITLEAGHAYNFVFSKEAPGEEIKFALKEVEDWNPTPDGAYTPIQ